jgi:hypothetical protein
LCKREPQLTLECASSDRISTVEGWIEERRTDGDNVRIQLTTTDGLALALLIERGLLEQSAGFKVLNDLRGRRRFLKVLARQQMLDQQPVLLEKPHQLEIGP